MSTKRSGKPLPKIIGTRKESYCVSFDTTTTPGFVRAVKITIEEELIADDEQVRVDLAAHPLYPHLVQYVRGNPHD